MNRRATKSITDANDDGHGAAEVVKRFEVVGGRVET